ncbi:MAG: choice-of-anchor J domain-containing protein [Ignavibacteria bacterium]
MKKNFSFLVVFAFLISSIILGFSMSNTSDDKPSRRSDYKTDNVSATSDNIRNPMDQRGPRTFDKSTPVETRELDAPYYTDNFDGANDTTSLKARGYGVYYRGGGAQGLTATWYQGTIAVFNAFNGPDTGYVAANYNVVTGANNIDSWLVLPANNVSAGDFIKFYCRSIVSNPFPDSVRVMYNASGGSTPESAGWVELGRFLANPLASGWELRSYSVSTSGATGRFAIRYNVVDGGPLGNNSNFIGIDALTLEPPAGSSDIATTAINAPGNLLLPTPTIAPKATYQNVGSAAQTNIPVTFKITGPVPYTSTKMIASLGVGASITVTFDSTFVPTAGSYNNTVYCSLGSDGNRSNDTLKSSFNAVDANYGTQNGISFANTLATGAPSYPTFCWKDTSGSTSLYVDTANVSSAPFTGSLDDGYWRVGNALNGKKIRLGGVSYDSFFVATNSIVGFANNSGLTSFSPSTSSTVRPAIYPLWMDMDWRGTSRIGSGRISYKVINDYQLLISYDRGYEYAGGVPEANDYVSYQVVIELMDANASANSRMIVQIADGTDGRTGSQFLTYYNTNLLNTHSMGVQTAAGNAAYYRFANPLTSTYPGPLFGPSNTQLAVEYGNNASVLNQSCTTVGFTFTGSIEAMTPFATGDTINVQLRGSTSPYAVVDAMKGYMNGSGVLSGVFEKGGLGPYYVRFSHRNALETWSSGNVSPAGLSSSYDFTTNINKAFGNNMVNIGGEASFYSGDVTQDGVIDVTDLSDIDNDAYNFVSGYVKTDVNNDGVVDVTDATYADNNAYNFVAAIIP